MTEPRLEAISGQIENGGGKNLELPPLHLWNPELSGDIDIVIQRDGQWVHEGGVIKRQPLVNLFASILRREDDGDYYLVTPVEKWRVQVEALPLLVTDFEWSELGEAGAESPAPQLVVTLNTGRRYRVSQRYALHPSGIDGAEAVPAVDLDYGLSALFSRSAWYRLAEYCEERDGATGVASGPDFYILG